MESRIRTQLKIEKIRQLHEMMHLLSKNNLTDKINHRPMLPVLRTLLAVGFFSQTSSMARPPIVNANETFRTPPTTVETRGDQPYLEPGRREKLDLYLPKKRSKVKLHPAVVLIHGGGWNGGNKRAAREVEIGITLAENGFVAASIDYAVQAAGKFPINLQDCKNAVRYLRIHSQELGVDPDRIAVLGGSAGGHLALMVAYTGDDAKLAPIAPYPGISDKVSAVVDMYGISDIERWKKTDSKGNPTELRGVYPHIRLIFGERPEEWAAASPISHVHANLPPTLILHGKMDTTVDRDQSSTLYAALKKAKAKAEIVWLGKAGHTFAFKYAIGGEPLERDLGPLVIQFLNQNL